jgi:hypothetical protein
MEFLSILKEKTGIAAKRRFRDNYKICPENFSAALSILNRDGLNGKFINVLEKSE